MDGRWSLVFAGGLIIGLAGCNTTKNTLPEPPTTTAEPPLSLSAKPSDDKENKGPVKVETLLAVAAVRMESARMPDRSDRERDKLYQESKSIYQQALAREPKNVNAMLGMAQVHRGMQEKEACVDWYQKALKISPNNAAIWGEMGQSLDSLKDREAAIACYHSATKIDASNKDYKKALGFALARGGRYDEGIAWLSKCMSEADAHVAIGRMMDHNGHHDQASHHFTMALKSDPGNETARLALSGRSSPEMAALRDVNPIQAVRYEEPAVTSSLQDPPPLPAKSQNNRLPPPPVQGWIQSR
jgi:tetratricopeptide (TPR) repeat protein